MRIWRTLPIALALAVGSLPVAAATHATAVHAYVVNSTGNGADSSTADGICNDGSGNCTLRAAIEQANASTGSDEIDFSIGTGAQTIQVPGGVGLPALTDTITIDATTQPGYSTATGHPVITIDGLGQGAAYSVDGLVLNGTGDTVIGLDVIRFTAFGILVHGSGAVIEGCYLGVDHTGLLRRGNTGGGVYLGGNNGTVSAAGAGVLNVISGNGFNGVTVPGTLTGNAVSGALIGLTADGTAPIPNSAGVTLAGSDNTLGAPGQETVISGNLGTGVDVQGANNAVQDVRVGTNPAGTAAIGNSTGVLFEAGAAGSTLTGSVISGNSTGVVTAPGTTVSGNFIGTDASGTTAVGNGTGVSAQGTGFNAVIGGTPGSGNLISGNTVGISDNTGSDTVQGNDIGTDITGTIALPNQTGAILGGSGENHFTGNLVAGNTGDGVQLSGDSHHVDGNLIGVTYTGTALPNGGNGITVGGDGFDFIGTTSANTIANNGGDGIAVTAGQNTTMEGNSIHDNGGLGVDLGADGVTPDDAGDADTGANGLQNFPVLTSAHVGFKSTVVHGTLNSAASSTYRIDLYASPSCDASGNGEGATWLGSANVTTDGTGDASFGYTSHTLTPPHSVVTATATDADGSTSEFSACRTVTGVTANILVTVTQDRTTVAAGDPVTYDVKIGNSGPGVAGSVKLIDTLSFTATFASIAPSQGSCATPTSNKITCSLGSLAKDATATVEIVLSYKQTGSARETARVSSTAYDPDLTDDVATIHTRVT